MKNAQNRGFHKKKQDSSINCKPSNEQNVTDIKPESPESKSLRGLHQSQVAMHDDLIAPIEDEWEVLQD